MNSNNSMQFLIKAIRPLWRWIVVSILVLGVWAASMSLRPYLLKIMVNASQFTHEKANSHALTTLVTAAIGYLGVQFLVSLIWRINDWSWLKLRPALKTTLMDQLSQRILQQTHLFFQNNFTGSLANNMKEVIQKTPDLLEICIMQFIGRALVILGAIYTASTVNYKFALSLGVWVLSFFSGSFFLTLKGRSLSSQESKANSALMGQIVDVIGNVMSIRLFARKSYEINRLHQTTQKMLDAERAFDWLFLKIFFFQGFTFLIYETVCVIWLVLGVQKGEISAGDFAFILALNGAIIDCLWTLSRDLTHFNKLYGNIQQSLKILLTPIQMGDTPPSQTPPDWRGHIEFEEVKFSHTGSATLFEGANISIPAGQKVGLVGHSGSGKSTFVNLILRLFDVDSGRITIDGRDIRDLSQDILHEAIGMIPQDPSLFYRSIKENIGYGRLDATEDQIIQAAREANADHFIPLLPEGYDSLVGERGVKLSGGQRQRIAIARAFLKNAPILILDEATSQLDSITEAHIQESLWKLMQNKTTLVIAHRLSTLLKMDRILVFDQGKIVEEGSHAELLAKDGIYKSLWERQVGGFLTEPLPVV